MSQLTPEQIALLLGDRQAKCFCGATAPSHKSRLAFFQYLGEGSRNATERCACGYSEVVHHPINAVTGRAGITDHAFEPVGAEEYDSFYCGCRGWD